jgi:nucleotide-binding universal stress UspA family protein
LLSLACIFFKVYLLLSGYLHVLVEIKFSKILVGVDGSKESMDAADYAIGLAKKDNAKLICFTAMQLPSFYGRSAIEPPTEWQEKDGAEMQQWT